MMPDNRTPGTRVYPDANGYLDGFKICQPAAYGLATAGRVQGTRAGWWQITAPDRGSIALNPTVHTVVEHDDGTITVTPSIDLRGRRAPGFVGWHGWLTRGVFESVP